MDPYYGVRPCDYPNTKWTCVEIDMFFTVSDDSLVEKCEIIDKNGETIEVSLLWSALDSSVNINSLGDEEVYFHAYKCKFGKKKFVMYVSDINNSNLDHIPEKLTFYRSDI